jgi:hypothetical protein
VRIGPVRITWLATAVLATFVLFAYCIATVGGEDDPVRQPTQPTPEASASPMPVASP